jgi:hypothetical protein
LKVVPQYHQCSLAFVHSIATISSTLILAITVPHLCGRLRIYAQSAVISPHLTVPMGISIAFRQMSHARGEASVISVSTTPPGRK